MPQNPCIIATKSPSAEVCIFDYTKHPSVPAGSASGLGTQKASPQLTLLGHKKEGYGLSWSPATQGRLLSGADDGMICYWDLNTMEASANTLMATRTFTEHTSVVEDVAWHPQQADIFGSVGDDGRFLLWDMRSASMCKADMPHSLLRQ